MWRVPSLYDVTKRNNKESGHIATKLLKRCGEHAHADGVAEDTWSIFSESGVEMKNKTSISVQRAKMLVR